MTYSLSEVRKALVPVLVVAAQAADLGLIPAPYDRYGVLILGVASVFGVYKAKNSDGPVSPRSVDGQDYQPVEQPPADEAAP